MSTPFLIFIVVSAVAVLLFMVLKLKISAFISLLITSIYVGIVAGMPLIGCNTGHSGWDGRYAWFCCHCGWTGCHFWTNAGEFGRSGIAGTLPCKKIWYRKASWAMVITGFIVAIPVFLDVGFIILVPIIYAFSRDTKRSLLYYGIPLLAGLAVTHSFIPPTPGPVAVADIMNAQLGLGNFA